MNNSLLQYIVVAAALVANFSRCGGRDLRPSDHGLEYQQNSPPPAQNDDTQDMRSFFGTMSSVELPEAKNISDTWQGGRARDAGRDHVRLVLLVASAVCGFTGVVLLAISGVVFLFRKKEGKIERTCSTSAQNSSPASHAEMKISG